MFGIFLELVSIVFNPIGFVLDVIRDSVVPRNGTVVYCKIGPFEHTGIYISAYRQILHRNRHGHIELVPPCEFTVNYGDTIYVSCNDNVSLESSRTADRALTYYKSESWEAYDIVGNNCHEFSVGCFTGNFHSNAFTFFMLEVELRLATNHKNWRMWKTENSNYLY
jgi:hypothetical protein